MFISLFNKECKLILKSITYYVLSICMIVFFVFQIGNFSIRKPEPSDKYFGYVTATDKTEIMKEVTENLEREYKSNEYNTYPFGFVKVVNLDDSSKEEVGKILQEINNGDLNINDENSYDEFLEKMDSIDKIIGGGSKYESHKIKTTKVPATYEQALESYNEILEEDHISSAVARNFSDYAGIVAGIMPVFLAVSVALRDKKAKSLEVIYSSKASSVSIILARYLAVVLMIMIPVIIVAFIQDTQCIYYAQSHSVEPHYLAFIKCILGWILPSVMVSSAVGFFFTELSKGVWAIFIQIIWWFISLISNDNLTGGIGYNLIPRFNCTGNRDIFLSVYNELVINRILYFSISIILVVCTICIYNYRRCGRLKLNGKILSNSKS